MFSQGLIAPEISVPYMVRSEITIKMVSQTTYDWLLTEFDKTLKKTIQSLNPQLLNTSVFLMEVFMSPENLRWKLWKSVDEIMAFIMNIDHEILEMQGSQDRMVETGHELLVLHQKLRGQLNFQEASTMDTFVYYLNLLAKNIYTPKSEEFLLFIEHCAPIDKCNLPF